MLSERWFVCNIIYLHGGSINASNGCWSVTDAIGALASVFRGGGGRQRHVANVLFAVEN